MDASHELIRAALAALRTTPAVTELVDQRIYDRVPEDGALQFPYVSVGPSSANPDDYDCRDGEEITFQLDVWSSGAGEAYGSAQCRDISSAIKRVLHNADLALTTNALVTMTWALTRIIDDPDPTIHHGVVQFTATVETP